MEQLSSAQKHIALSAFFVTDDRVLCVQACQAGHTAHQSLHMQQGEPYLLTLTSSTWEWLPLLD